MEIMSLVAEVHVSTFYEKTNLPDLLDPILVDSLQDINESMIK